MNILSEIKSRPRDGRRIGIYSCCSSNRFVIEAAIRQALATDTTLLIEATANQVNQFGGYTGMTPLDFQKYVRGIAKKFNLPLNRLILGGDHLGPLTWKHLPEIEAMEHAKQLIENYIAAGFSKIHLDTSMRLGTDDKTKPLSDAVIAARAAYLCHAAEKKAGDVRQKNPEIPLPYYVIGSEVPIPGGAREDHESIEVTHPEDCIATIESFRSAFQALKLDRAWSRVIGVVVQPGVEFGDTDVFYYNHSDAAALCKVLDDYPGLVFEGHSTDYQTKEALLSMVQDGIAILKVGPALTFALRQGLFALEHIEIELYPDPNLRSAFRKTLDCIMLENPVYWKSYYSGSEEAIRFKRAFSQSDRCRYYLNDARIEAAINRLLDNLSRLDIPLTLLSQYLPIQYNKVREGRLSHSPHALLLDVIGATIEDYLYAVQS